MLHSYQTGCGGTMLIPRTAQEHLVAHPTVAELLGEALQKLKLPTDGSFLLAEVDMGRLVGNTGAVKTAPVKLDEPTLFAHREAREKPSRVTFEIGPMVSTVVVIAFPAKGEAGKYILITSFVGTIAPREPWDRNLRTETERQESLKFWCSTALTHDPSVMGEVFESTWEEILNF